MPCSPVLPSHLHHRTCRFNLNTTSPPTNARKRLQCRSVVADDGGAPPSPPTQSTAEAHDRLNKLVALIQTAEMLAPFDPDDYNAALLLWNQIAAIPPSLRPSLLDRLRPTCVPYLRAQLPCTTHTHAGPRDILRLWQLAGQRYKASRERVVNATQNYSLWTDMPTQPGQACVGM